MSAVTPSLDTLIAPRAVAIVGASMDHSKTAGRPVHFLRRHGFLGAIWPVNPTRRDVQGLPAFPNLKTLPGVPDQIFIVLDTEPAMAMLEEAVEIGVPLVQILANGFSESGPEGRARETRLKALIAGSRTRVLGPNSLGIVRPSNGFVCTANAAFAAERIPSGQISVLSQSGTAIGTFVSRGRARGIGFANLVSVGNEADLSLGEVGRRLVEDDETKVFILFLETIRHADALEEFSEAAASANKEVLVYKIGRSAVGAELAVSHTGALVSSDAAADAYFRDLGFSRVDVFEAVFEGAPLFSARWCTPNHATPRVAIVSTTGGGGALVADRLGLAGVKIAGPSEATRARIAAAGCSIGSGPLIDLTLAGTRADVMSSAIEAVLDDDMYDAVVAVIGSSAEHFPELAVKPILDVLERRARPQKPVVVFTVPNAERALALLAEGGVAGFRAPEACADALVARLRLRTPHHYRTRAQQAVPDIALTVAALPDVATELSALDLFQQLGIPTVARRFVPIEATSRIADLATGLRPPLVVKASSPELPHKSEVGGVVLDITGIEGLRAAVERVQKNVTERAPTVRLEGFLLQEQRRGLQEIIVGLSRDAGAGALVTLGIGGVLAELYADTTLRRAPVDIIEARQMIEEVKGLAISRGYRGAPGGDLTALAEAIAAFSRLGAYDRIAEAEINPLMIGMKGEGVWAVDGLVVLAPLEEK